MGYTWDIMMLGMGYILCIYNVSITYVVYIYPCQCMYALSSLINNRVIYN